VLIRTAEIDQNVIADVRIEGAQVVAVGNGFKPGPNELVLDASGQRLLSGLHDHHIHLLSLAASLDSVPCGPPHVLSAQDLMQRLRAHAADSTDDQDWVRGVGYHESVAGDIDRDWLDLAVTSKPVRIQHRSGRLWIFNSRGLERLASSLSRSNQAPLQEIEGRLTGRLYDADDWLRERIGGQFPSLRRVSHMLASYGVTGVTDTTPHNTLHQYRYFMQSAARGELLQRMVLMGDASLDEAEDIEPIRRGATKVHLHESTLPDFDAFRELIVRSHAAGRPVAVHCVTQTELVFTAAAFEAAGSRHGDRIEHASIAPPDTLALLASQGLRVVTQPNFIRERGDVYATDVPVDERRWLYRGRGFLDAGIPLAAGTDAPYGEPNPWLAMQAAVDRRTSAGQTLGANEALTPEQALDLFGGDPLSPGRGQARITPGMRADLCLLDRTWSIARADLAEVRIQATVRNGELIYAR